MDFQFGVNRKINYNTVVYHPGIIVDVFGEILFISLLLVIQISIQKTKKRIEDPVKHV